MEYKHARYDLQKSIKAAKRTYTQKLESCYRENNTRLMWQVIQLTTNYREVSVRTVTSNASFMDNLNSFFLRFDQHNKDVVLKNPHNPAEIVLHVSHTQVVR